MLKKKGMLLYIVFLVFLIIPVAFANTNYNETGNKDALFEQGRGFFNTELTDTDIATKTIATARHTPLIADLDGDGINEIIVIDDNTIRLFKNKELTNVNSIALPDDDRYSNMLVFDIDKFPNDNNFTELIVVQEERSVLLIIEYNGTDMTIQANISIADATSHVKGNTAGEVIIKCRGTNDCFMGFVTEMDTGFTPGQTRTRRVFGAFFNSTFVGHETELDSTGAGFQTHCLPSVRTMPVVDYDNDGDDEYIVTTMQSGGSADEEVHIFWVEVLSNHSVIEEFQFTETDMDDIITIGGTTDDPVFCDDSNGNIANNIPPGRFFTSALTYDIDSPSSNGLETVVAFKLDATDFTIKSYDGCSSDGCTITEFDDYPETCDTFGNCPTATAISNVFKADVFPGAEGVDDFCVIGFDNINEELDAICGSETSTVSLTETVEFLFDTPFNLTNTYGFSNNIAHSAQHSTLIVSGKDLNEFITSYGVQALFLNGTGLLSTLQGIFANPRENGAVLSIDAEKINAPGGREDLIVLTSTNLFYIDDRFSNSGANISFFSVNPCLDSTWKVNTSVEVVVRPQDDEADAVSARAILYQGETNEQDSGFSANVSSGTDITFGFTANLTIGSSTLRLQARDTENPSEINTIDLTFSVGSNGVVFGDCKTETTVDIGIQVEDGVIDEATLTEDATDNSIISGINTFIGLTGIAGTTLWLVLMIIFSFAVWSRAGEIGWSGNSALGVIAFTNALLIILGARLGILSTGLVIIITVIAVVIIGVFLGSFLTGSRANSE